MLATFPSSMQEEVVGGKPNPYEVREIGMSNISRRSSKNLGLEKAKVDL
jgi:hypothetical protein